MFKCYIWFLCIFTVPTRPNLIQEHTPAKSWVYFLGLLRVCFLKICVLSGVFGGGFTRDLFSVYSGFAFRIHLHWSVEQTCLFHVSYHLTACNSRPSYIPNTYVWSAFRGLLLIGVYSLFHYRFTLGLLGVYYGSVLVNPEQTPKVNIGFIWVLLFIKLLSHKSNDIPIFYW